MTNRLAERKTKAQKRMEYAVSFLQEYMQTYSTQPGYLDYQDATFIDDVLCGLGFALGRNRGPSGYEEFKIELRKHLADCDDLATQIEDGESRL